MSMLTASQEPVSKGTSMTQELLGRVHRELLDVLNSINQDKIHHDGDDFHELLNDVEKALAETQELAINSTTNYTIDFEQQRGTVFKDPVV